MNGLLLVLPLALANEITIPLSELVAGVRAGGGPDVSGLLFSSGTADRAEWSVYVNEQGNPIASREGARFVVEMGCAHFHSREVLTFSCTIEVRELGTNLVRRIGTRDKDDPIATSVQQALGIATADLQDGVTGAFNVTSAAGSALTPK